MLIEFYDEIWNYQLGVSVAVQYEVLRLQVSVYDAFGVQVGEGFNHTGGVESGGWIFKRTPETQTGQKLWDCEGSLRFLCSEIFDPVKVSDITSLTSCSIVLAVFSCFLSVCKLLLIPISF